MTWTRSLVARRIWAVLILLAALGLGWEGVIAPLTSAVQWRRDRIAMLTAQLDHARAIAARRPELLSQANQLSARVASETDFWPGPNTAGVVAAMQDDLRQAALTAEGRLKSTSQGAETTELGLKKITVQFSVDGTIATLQQTLTAIEATKPRLFVDGLTVIAIQGNDAGQTHLALEFEVSGYMLGESPL